MSPLSGPSSRPLWPSAGDREKAQSFVIGGFKRSFGRLLAYSNDRLNVRGAAGGLFPSNGESFTFTGSTGACFRLLAFQSIIKRRIPMHSPCLPPAVIQGLTNNPPTPPHTLASGCKPRCRPGVAPVSSWRCMYIVFYGAKCRPLPPPSYK